ncbi:aminoglycoside N(6')-acetyltransferase [Hymenobacter qilianensis]|uniref:Aminoglycoside N(6')-acetyltransferase n=2 Tax=Hymenobacter qilianensis TaxID=1385715 RepID=A0ACB5PS66_9BACT|nr:GNAT family protein [Hymenobacter qilianensis]QNP52308.1 GNAT family N-acetyltransferase [Hymenobacter qilianensis]GGF66321.1 aminoglycoside N(6')-acetyltransferase [Hymenobacter qilianensis]
MIRLEYFTPADFQQLIQWIDTEKLLKEWSGSLFSFPLTEASLTWYIEGANDLTDPDAFIYKAIDTETGETVGHISLGSFSETNKAARITRVLIGNTAARGRGYCQGMIKAVLRIGFEELGLHRISLGVYDFNEAAIGCYKKAGLKIEGVMRDVVRYKDGYWSLVEMAVLEDEWRLANAAESLPITHTTATSTSAVA